MELIFNTKPYKGKVTKNARVISNDSTQNNGTIMIDISADVFPLTDSLLKIKFTPEQPEFDMTKKKQVVTIENLTDATINLAQASQILDDMQMKVKDNKIKPGKKGKVELEWKSDFPKKDTPNSITFNTGLDSLARFTIPYVIKGTEPPPPPPTPTHQGAQPANKMNPAQGALGKQPSAPADTNKAGGPAKLKQPNPFGTTQIPADSGKTVPSKPETPAQATPKTK